jgi:hypothetical protein
VSAKGITDELVQQVADDLRARYELDDGDMRALDSRLADSAGARSTETTAPPACSGRCFSRSPRCGG